MTIDILPEDMKEDGTVLILSDEGQDDSGYISISMGQTTREFHIDELMPALVAFDCKISRAKEERKIREDQTPI